MEIPSSANSAGPLARRLMRSCDRASLATAMVEGGWPYASLVVVACDHTGAPLLMLSDMAEHAKNLAAARGRCALLFDGTQGYDNPLTGPRVTVLGRLAACDDEAMLARFVARHPDADTYAGFGDFHLYRMAVERAHLVAGFGLIRWVDAVTLLFDAGDAADLAAAEPGIVAHMNDDHREAIQLCAHALLGLDGEPWDLTGLDPEGVDLRLGGRVARLCFDEPVSNSHEARNALILLINKARTAHRRDA